MPGRSLSLACTPPARRPLRAIPRGAAGTTRAQGAAPDDAGPSYGPSSDLLRAIIARAGARRAAREAREAKATPERSGARGQGAGPGVWGATLLERPKPQSWPALPGLLPPAPQPGGTSSEDEAAERAQWQRAMAERLEGAEQRVADARRATAQARLEAAEAKARSRALLQQLRSSVRV
mmetsp:Transcript_45492/g.116408  ORF Transcript_45492/g.116408 Transcript_45492/m.116408 type:complete len:179 (-) Transcript_45492:173-709(-)